MREKIIKVQLGRLGYVLHRSKARGMCRMGVRQNTGGTSASKVLTRGANQLNDLTHAFNRSP